MGEYELITETNKEPKGGKTWVLKLKFVIVLDNPFRNINGEAIAKNFQP